MSSTPRSRAHAPRPGPSGTRTLLVLTALLAKPVAASTLATATPSNGQDEGTAPQRETTGHELTAATFDHWREYIHPNAEELRWQAIPWRASFWQGVVDAQRVHKPVLLWAMNGHPMGCT